MGKTYLAAITASKEAQDAVKAELQAREAGAMSVVAVVRVEAGLANAERVANEYLTTAKNFDIQTYADYLANVKAIQDRIADLKAIAADLFPAK